MNISINNALFDIIPQLKIGIIHYTKISVSESPQMLKARFQLFQDQLYFELSDKSVNEIEEIREWRDIWKRFGADPNRYRHSAEALTRRVAKQNFLQPFHSAVDLNNLFSLQFKIPIGIYDVSKIVGNIEVNVGDEETGYDGINGRYNSLKRILHLADEEGPFGSPFVDSMRTSVTEQTTEALHVFFLLPSMSNENVKELLLSAKSMFTQIHSGESKSYILDIKQKELSIH